MPGGGKKFTIRYDAESDRYWALVTPAEPGSLGLTHGGIYANGIHAGLTRNTLTLISSKDLREWREERVVLSSDNPFFDGFQYVDWQFDGDDIVAVIRMAIEECPAYTPEKLTVASAPAFADAVATARTLAKEGGCVLLSPACASFDAFRNFAERGNTFRTIVDGFSPAKDTKN